MRKRINRKAICSSYNYKASRKAHMDYLKESHSHFSGIAFSGELSIDVPVIKDNAFTPRFKTIKVFGKDMTVTIEEYNTYCKEIGF